jgi:hypothetical protein
LEIDLHLQRLQLVASQLKGLIGWLVTAAA